MNLTVPALLLAAAVIIGLAWWYRRMRSDDTFAGIMLRHRANARISSRADLIDGANRVPVALTLEPQRIFYENADLQADLDISGIEEVEYGSDLMTGKTSGGSVLRLRAHGRAIEFVLEGVAAREWERFLPAHRMGESGTVHAT